MTRKPAIIIGNVVEFTTDIVDPTETAFAPGAPVVIGTVQGSDGVRRSTFVPVTPTGTNTTLTGSTVRGVVLDFDDTNKKLTVRIRL